MAGQQRSVDIKLSFEQYDMVPGQGARKFRRNLIIYGGKADSMGYSLADCLLRIDGHAVQRGQNVQLPPPGGVLAAPGAGPVPGGGGPLQVSYQTRRTRLKESYRFVLMHISDETTLSLYDDTSAEFQNGPDLFEKICEYVIVAPNTSETQEMVAEIWAMEIIVDVGIAEDTVKTAWKMLRLLNSELPATDQLTNDKLGEKLLSMIKNASSLFWSEATSELNAVDGVPGQESVRELAGLVRGPACHPAKDIVLSTAAARHGAVSAMCTSMATGRPCHLDAASLQRRELARFPFDARCPAIAWPHTYLSSMAECLRWCVRGAQVHQR